MGIKNGHEDIKRQFIALLKQVGENSIEKYQDVLDVFFENDEPLSARQLSVKLSSRGIQLGEDEIAAMLHTFVRYSIANVIRTDEGTDIFEHLHINEHHDHLICTKCKRIFELSSAELEDMQEEITLKNKFYPFYHRLQIYGICEDCLGKRKSLLPLSYASRGEFVRIEQIVGGEAFSRRLQEMGLFTGMEVKVINNTGAFILQVGEMRLAIGRGMSHKIMVSPILQRSIQTS